MMSQQQTPLNVLLLGDSCVDEYYIGSVNRISPEAPIPILDFKNTKQTLGMGGNVYNNLINLGCSVTSYLGDAGVKQRFIDSKSNHQLLRVDYPPKTEVKFHELEKLNYDLVVISDYDKGFLSYEDIIKIKSQYECPIFIDTKKTDLKWFEGCFVKINSLEYSRLTSKCSNIIITHGGDKVVFERGEFKVPTVEAFDVCGAGDTFLASVAYQYAFTKDIHNAIQFAMVASSITVKHLGVYAPSLEEIYNEIRR